jgi:adenine-specific DNA-methyltransferase
MGSGVSKGEGKTVASNFEKLQTLLEELFQLDQADLDFGIYRIMNQRRNEIVRFLKQDLLPQVQDAFSQYKSADKAELQEALNKLVENVANAGMNPDDSPRVKELRQRLADSSVDVAALENEVFSHLYTFFRRYYDEGDFISQRRYKEGVYAIPYEGEEVKLHWANHDQYYVKSSEYFRDYAFKVESGQHVRVHLVAASTEQDNNKAPSGKERRFFLCEENPLVEEDGELFIHFEYRLAENAAKQDELNKKAIERILNEPGFEKWAHELAKLAPTDNNRNRTVLERHLTQYTARNTFDYFIHKDLGGNTAKVTLCLLPVAPTTSDAAEHIGLASVDVIGSARRTAVDARQSAAVPAPTLRVRCEVTPQGMPPRSRGAVAVPRRLGVAACVASAPFGL